MSKSRYTKENPRIVVKFIDNNTDETLFEIKDRNWMNLGELFTDHVVNSLVEQELKNIPVEPDEILVLAVGVFKKT